MLLNVQVIVLSVLLPMAEQHTTVQEIILYVQILLTPVSVRVPGLRLIANPALLQAVVMLLVQLTLVDYLRTMQTVLLVKLVVLIVLVVQHATTTEYVKSIIQT